MKVLLVVDGHLVRTPDGNVWSSRIYNYNFFARYLSVFEKVKIAIRIKNVQNNDGFPNLCSGPNIEFYDVEEFRGPKEYLLKYYRINKNISKAFDDCDCAIFRIPSTTGFAFVKKYIKTRKPFALEVVIDPWDFAAPGMLRTPLRPIIRFVWTYELKKLCMKANGVSYVTKFALQKRYPCKAMEKKQEHSEKYFTEYYSSANISDDFYSKSRSFKNKNEFSIIHVSNSISNFVKGHRELIEAVYKLKKENIIIKVIFVGDGAYIDYFKKFAKIKKVDNQIEFIGKLSNIYEIKEELEKNDIFVFPSHAEGLPRVLIEAMATGLPCISTNINGIPELLNDNYLVEVGNSRALADKIKYFIKNPKIMEQASAENIEVAKDYSESVLQKRRKIFYKKLYMLAYKNNYNKS